MAMNALGKMLNMTNIRKIQVKSTVRYQFTPIGHILLKHLKITSVYQRYGEVGMPCIAGREVKQCGQHHSIIVSQNIENGIST